MLLKQEIKRNSILEKVEIADAVAEGKSIARVDGMVIFIEGGVPGDIVDLKIRKVKSNYAEAYVVHIHQPSPHRLEPFCEHFGSCGGCIWQHMDYEKQLVYKQKQVEDAIEKLGKVEAPPVMPILRSAKTRFYRNRLDFAFSNRRWITKEELEQLKASEETIPQRPALGFHIRKHFDKILDINKCWLQDDLTNQIRNAIKEIGLKNNLSFFDPIKQEGFLRNIVIRNTTTGEWMLIVVFHTDDKKKRDLLLEEVAQRFSVITSFLYIINPKRNDTFYDLDVHVFKGADHITEVMESHGKKLKFKISAKSFFQTNSEQAAELYKVARDFAGLTGKEVVYDLYTGTGTIAIFVAADAKKVIGIDYVPDAIEDAKENSRYNSITNTEFFAGDLKDTLTNDFVTIHGKPDVVITDPPRAGMHGDVVQRLLEIAPEKIVYVSCNPATQARDINLLSTLYKVEKLQPVDMFPHTIHVENVALLKKFKV